MNIPPKPPPHLGPAGAEVWRGVQKNYVVEAGHHLALLRGICEARDRQVQATAIIDREGLLVDGGHNGRKSNPMIAVERDARIAVVRGLRELALGTARGPADRDPDAAQRTLAAQLGFYDDD